MSKIGDLFVRLGLKKDEFSKGISDAKREVSGFGDTLKKLASGAKVAWAAVGAAVVKFATDAVRMTQKWGDEWRSTMAGVNAAYGVFVRQLASGEGFDNLFANMREAARLAREAAAALDEIFERKTSYGYTEAITKREIAQLQLIMRDSSKSDEERKKAAEMIIQKEKELGNVKKDIANQEANAYKKQLQAQTKLTDSEIQFITREYNQNREVIQQGREYLKQKAQFETKLANAQKASGAGLLLGNAYKNNQADINAATEGLRNLEANTSQAIKDVAALTQKYDKGNDELISNLAKAEIAVINVDTEMYHAQTRATSILGTLNKVSASGGASASNPELDAAARILKRAQDSAKNEIQLYYEKYQEEKALLEKYNIDTTALTQEYFRNINGIIEKGLDEIKAPLVDFEPVELELIDVDESVLEEFVDKIDAEVKRAQDVAKEFGNAVAGGFADSCQELMDQLMGLREFNPGSVVKALLEPLADMAVKAGTIIAAEGVATMAANSALKTFGETGWGAVAAGAALIAAGTAAKAGLAALASGGSTTTSTSGYTGGGTTTGDQNIQTEMTIYVEGRLSGSDIVLSGQKTVNSWNR